MRVHSFVDEGLGHSSYVIDLGRGSAVIVDPPRFPIAQENAVETLGLRLAWTLDTHSHADYVTGSPSARRPVRRDVHRPGRLTSCVAASASPRPRARHSRRRC